MDRRGRYEKGGSERPTTTEDTRMSHIKKITLGKAEGDDTNGDLTPDEISDLLNQTFGFVLELVSRKGKGEPNGNGTEQ